MRIKSNIDSTNLYNVYVCVCLRVCMRCVYEWNASVLCKKYIVDKSHHYFVRLISCTIQLPSSLTQHDRGLHSFGCVQMFYLLIIVFYLSFSISSLDIKMYNQNVLFLLQTHTHSVMRVNPRTDIVGSYLKIRHH